MNLQEFIQKLIEVQNTLGDIKPEDVEVTILNPHAHSSANMNCHTFDTTIYRFSTWAGTKDKPIETRRTQLRFVIPKN